MKRPFIRGPQGTFPLDKDFEHRPEGVQENLGCDGLHDRVLTHLPPTEENVVKFITHNSSEDDFWNDIERVLEHCDKTMLELGWDRKAGNGRDFPSDRTAQPYSKLWYAGQIGLQCWILLGKREQTDHDVWTLRQTLSLGMLIAEADWRLSFRSDIKRGKGTKASASDGGKARAREMEAATSAIISEMKRLIDNGATVSAAAKIAANRGYGTGDNANRGLWYRHRNKTSH